MASTAAFQVKGTSKTALFSLKIHRGEGMALLAMNWKKGEPPADFVGFAIQYKEPGGEVFFALKNRLTFPQDLNSTDPDRFSTLRSPIQKFRWVHFPRNADMEGTFTYRVTPIFMNAAGERRQGDAQEASLELRGHTVPGLLNLGFTRGFVSSQAFVDLFGADAIPKLLPAEAEQGLAFKPTFDKKEKALSWMGFEARRIVLDLLDEAIADQTAQVRVVAYDLNVPEIVERLEKLGPRLMAIIDDSADHGKPDSAERTAEQRLVASAGAANVKRQHMGSLQHNKVVAVVGDKVKAAICGSTNFSWRGLYVQANNAIVVRGAAAAAIFMKAFDSYWTPGTAAAFCQSAPAAAWQDLGLKGVDAKVTFSPHAAANAQLGAIATDVSDGTKSSLFYSLAFLHQTEGPLREAIKRVTLNPKIFVYGMSDRKVGGIEVQKPDGNLAPVFPSQLSGKALPEPFKSEPRGGNGIQLHHKFVVVDFDKPTARVYMGSYNFSDPADRKNGENLLVFRDRRIATAYMIEAVRLFDHYQFRNKEISSTEPITLKLPPAPGKDAWWKETFATGSVKSRDRLLFS